MYWIICLKLVYNWGVQPFQSNTRAYWQQCKHLPFFFFFFFYCFKFISKGWLFYIEFPWYILIKKGKIKIIKTLHVDLLPVFVCLFVLNAFLNNCWISIIGTAKHDCLFVRASSQLQAATARNTSLQIKLESHSNPKFTYCRYNLYWAVLFSVSLSFSVLRNEFMFQEIINLHLLLKNPMLCKNHVRIKNSLNKESQQPIARRV